MNIRNSSMMMMVVVVIAVLNAQERELRDR